jgi:hypothetical protein
MVLACSKLPDAANRMTGKNRLTLVKQVSVRVMGLSLSHSLDGGNREIRAVLLDRFISGFALQLCHLFF